MTNVYRSRVTIPAFETGTRFLAGSCFLFLNGNSSNSEFPHRKWKRELAKQRVPAQKIIKLKLSAFDYDSFFSTIKKIVLDVKFYY